MLQQVIPGLYASVGTIDKSENPKRVAAFDLDWTLIRTIRGKFPKDANDWAFLPNRISTLKVYRDAGYILVIFTNQLSTGAKQTMLLSRINNVIAALAKEGISPWVLVSTNKDMYRKPDIGMWNVFAQYINPLDKQSSLYVGDAAGRPQDFDNTDRIFAQNIGILFYTPEEIFPNNSVTIPDTQTMFIFLGQPGSGKTSFYTQQLEPHGWIHANQDILKTQPKMLNTVKAALSSGKSVAVDATNPTADKRRQYIMLAAEYQIPTLIIYFVRDGHGWNDLRNNPVPNIAYNVYYKNLIEPTPEIDLVPVVQLF